MRGAIRSLKSTYMQEVLYLTYTGNFGLCCQEEEDIFLTQCRKYDRLRCRSHFRLNAWRVYYNNYGTLR
jgi:hypothetical protein